jgi:hypothetical protein
MVDAEIAGPRHGGGSAAHVIRDEMEPTRHMADGRWYTSKAKFRAATKNNGCIEVGNETNTLLKPRKPVSLSREQRRNEIRRAIRQLQGY